MGRIILSCITLFGVLALPSSAAPPSDRYASALQLLNSSGTDAQLAIDTCAKPSDEQQHTLQAIAFARNAVQDALNTKGGAARKDALAAAGAAYTASQMAAALALLETNEVSANYWADAADAAYQAAILIDKNVAR